MSKIRGAVWPLCYLTLSCVVVGTVLGLLNGETLRGLSWVLFVVACSLVGAFICARRPDNTVGWLLTLSAVSFGLLLFTAEYAAYGLVTHPGSLPASRAMAWPQSWLPFPGILSVATFLPQYFPNGRLLSPRWKPLVSTFAALAVFGTIIQAFRPDRLAEVSHSVSNPLGVDALRPLLGVGRVVSTGLIVAGMVFGTISLVQRYRQSDVQQRQQIKWLAFAIALAPVTWGITALAGFDPGGLLTTASLVALPAAVAVAVLRYNLYDIDLLINRTLVYGSLTLSLAGLYLLGVLGFQAVFRTIFGQTSTLAVALSTLGVAALFNPWRRQVQRFIDRRFYRRKYDMARTLAALQTRLRDEADLQNVWAHVQTALEETVEPAHVTLWLRDTKQHP